MTKEEIRAKAIECAKDVEIKCIQTKCSECSMYEECVYLTGIRCSTYSVWSYEQGFADGVKEFAEWLITRIHRNSLQRVLSETKNFDIKGIDNIISIFGKEQKNESKRRNDT